MTNERRETPEVAVTGARVTCCGSLVIIDSFAKPARVQTCGSRKIPIGPHSRNCRIMAHLPLSGDYAWGPILGLVVDSASNFAGSADGRENDPHTTLLRRRRLVYLLVGEDNTNGGLYAYKNAPGKYVDHHPRGAECERYGRRRLVCRDLCEALHGFRRAT